MVGGVNYFRSLFLALQATPEIAIEPVALIGATDDAKKYDFPPNVRVVRSAVLDRLSFPWAVNRLLSETMGVSLLSNRLLQREQISILSHGSPTGTSLVRNACWIPDFQHIHLPHFFSVRECRLRDSQYRANIERSDLVIVSSESAKRDLSSFCPRQEHKARVLRFAAIPPLYDPVKRLDLKSVYEIEQPYFYIPNQVWAHKNHLTAIEALGTIPDVKIVCSGALDDYRNPAHLRMLKDQINRLGLSERFIFLGRIPYAHIAELMIQATAVINPSLFEGWSTTVEEAKALGVRLILSDIPVHREQADGIRACFFSPLDSKQLAEQMTAALHSAEESVSPTSLAFALSLHQDRTRKFALEYGAIVRELMSEKSPWIYESTAK